MLVSPGRIAARAILASARGVTPSGGCRCRCCGTSPFDASCYALGETFSDLSELADPAAALICAGCASILGGRPGDDPPPLRTLNVLAVPGEPARYPATKDLSAVLRAPPAPAFVLAYAASMKRHASLRAEVSTLERYVIGTDTETVVFEPAAHLPLLDAVESLLTGFTRDEIGAGDWSPLTVSRFGPDRWVTLEAVVSAHRPSPVLDLVCALAARQERALPKEAALFSLDSLADERAALLLSYLAEASPHRQRDGIGFWRSFLRHRLARFAHRPLRDMLSSLADALACPPETQPDRGVAAALSVLDGIEDVGEVETAIRRRAVLVLTLTHQTMRQRIDARRQPQEPTP